MPVRGSVLWLGTLHDSDCRTLCICMLPLSQLGNCMWGMWTFCAGTSGSLWRPDHQPVLLLCVWFPAFRLRSSAPLRKASHKLQDSLVLHLPRFPQRAHPLRSTVPPSPVSGVGSCSAFGVSPMMTIRLCPGSSVGVPRSVPSVLPWLLSGCVTCTPQCLCPIALKFLSSASLCVLPSCWSLGGLCS